MWLRYSLISLLLLVPILSSAQSEAAPLKLGFGMMGISYLGDLTDQETSFRRFYPGGNLSIQFDGDAALNSTPATEDSVNK